MKTRLFQEFKILLPHVGREAVRAAIEAMLVEYCLDTECGTFRWQARQRDSFTLPFRTLSRLIGLPLVHHNELTLTVDFDDACCNVAIEARCATAAAAKLAAAVLDETISAAHKGLEQYLLEGAYSA